MICTNQQSVVLVVFEFAGNQAISSLAVVPPEELVLPLVLELHWAKEHDSIAAAVPLHLQERYYRSKVTPYYRLTHFACNNVVLPSGTCER
jgi:hypothetical protein